MVAKIDRSNFWREYSIKEQTNNFIDELLKNFKEDEDKVSIDLEEKNTRNKNEK